MILLRQKSFAKLEAGARVVRNIWYRSGKLLQPILKKSDRQISESAARIGRKVNKIIRRPFAVGSDVLVNFASRPLETAGMPLLVAPELISTGIGGGMVLIGRNLRKIKPIGRLSDNFAKALRNTGIYRTAQNSTRGFHNNFGLPKGVTYGALGIAGTATGRAIVVKRNKKQDAKKLESSQNDNTTTKNSLKIPRIKKG